MAELLSIYIYPYVFIVVLLGFVGFFKGGEKFSLPSVFLLHFLTVLLLLFRNPFAPDDAANYLQMYELQGSFNDVFTAYHGSYFFSFTQYVGNIFSLEGRSFLIAQSIFFYFISSAGLRMLFKSNRMYLMCLAFFSLTSTFLLLYTNVVRQGLALSLIIFSLGCFTRNFRNVGYACLFLSVFSHFSSVLIVGAIFLTRCTVFKKTWYLWLLIFLPSLTVVSQLFIFSLSSLGGFFLKIEAFSNINYNNTLVYVKVFLIYLSAVFFYVIGSKFNMFSAPLYRFVFSIYVFSIAIVFFTLPVLLLSSRYLYYSSALMPILYTLFFFNKPNFFTVRTRFIVGFSAIFILGFVVYNFSSTRSQLGI